MRKVSMLAAMGLVVLGVTGRSQGTVFHYQVIFSGPGESPPNASPGTGFGLVDWDTVANTMHLNASFSGLLGTTTASHIHSATTVPFAGTAGVATTTPTFAGFPLGVTAGAFDMTLDMTQASSYNPAFVTANGGTTASAEAALKAGIDAGEAYWNIHTTVVPGGEVRGFLIAVPEPASLGLLGCGGVLLTMRRRRA